MAVTEGVTAGFLEASPSADPNEGSRLTIGGICRAGKFVSPGTAETVTEIGWYCSGTSSNNLDVDVGIYTDGTDIPDSLVDSQTDVYAGGEGWVKVTGLNIAIDSSTTYWIAAWAENAADDMDVAIDSGERVEYTGSTAGLEGTWTPDWHYHNIGAFYAVWTGAAPEGTNMQVNIGDDWKAVPLMKINIGDAWKAVASAKINIGDAWKVIF